LLICPDLAMTDNLAFVLQHSGFQIVNAAGSKQALAEMGRSSPDLIVMRENSRRLNGDELCIRIRELSDVPIIVLGQEQKESAGVEFLEMGADAYLPTPLRFRELLARVRSLLRRTRPSSANTEEDS
jgi:DNA-binding response OmpR family regulator